MQENKKEDHKWYLAGKALTGELSSAEKVEWDRLLEDSSFRDEFEVVRKFWKKLGGLPFGQIDTAKDWQIVLKKVRKHPAAKAKASQRFSGNFLKYAAVLLLLVVSAYAIYVLNQLAYPSEEIVTSVQAPAGSKTMVTLPDSSIVWLNAGSKVTFNSDFGRHNRKIDLVGEAFFDVVKNNLPFKVHTPRYHIAVLGTAFNVQAYPEDATTTTTLVRGSLKVQGLKLANGGNEVLLAPNDRLVYEKQGNAVSSEGIGNSKVLLGKGITMEKGVDAEREIAWKNGWLAVQGESLKNLAIKMERLYDIKIHFEDEGLKSYRYTGRIRQLSLEQVLKALELTSPVAFTIEEKAVTIRENQSEKSKYKSLQTP